jgi:hypothetical protein
MLCLNWYSRRSLFAKLNGNSNHNNEIYEYSVLKGLNFLYLSLFFIIILIFFFFWLKEEEGDDDGSNRISDEFNFNLDLDVGALNGRENNDSLASLRTIGKGSSLTSSNYNHQEISQFVNQNNQQMTLL